MDSGQLQAALTAVGELVAADAERVAIVVVGGAAMNLLGIVTRSTSDIDVIARANLDEAGNLALQRAEPFPAVLQQAIRTVARDFALDPDWMNPVVGAQWTQCLPPGLVDEVTWTNYGGGLDVGLVGRRTLIALKLHAAVDSGANSVHMQDLTALNATDIELEEAAVWVIAQDRAEIWPAFVQEVVSHAQRRRS